MTIAIVAPAAVQLLQQLHHRLAVLRVEVSGRLVGEQDGGLPGHRAGDGDALLLAARELAGQVPGAVRHPDAFERRFDPLPALGRLHAAVGERQLDVLEDRQVANQVEALEDEPDLAVARARALGRREVRDGLAVEHVGAAGRRVEQAEDRQQRGLPAPGRPRDGEVLAVPDLEVDARERVRLHFIRVENLGDALEPEQHVVWCVHEHFPQRMRRRSRPSQADMSDRITRSPSRRPPTTSMVLTELRPNLTCTRSAASGFSGRAAAA